MKVNTSGVWERLQEAFGNAKPTKIASAGVTEQSVYRWRDGDLPGLDTLIKIYELRNVSLHWLLIGEGPKFIKEDKRAMLLK